MLEISVKDVTSGIHAKLGKLSKDSGLGTFAATTLARMMRPYIPERDSILINTYSIKPWQVSYTAPYARPMYEGVVKGTRVRYHKATAVPHWEKHVDKPSYAAQLQSYIKRVL